MEGRVVGWRGGERRLAFGALGSELPVEHQGVIGRGETPLRNPPHRGEDLLGGLACVDDDVAVFLTAELRPVAARTHRHEVEFDGLARR